MATCADCVHVEVCKEDLKIEFYPDEFDTTQMEKWSAHNCEHFKGRSRFVELPCKIGDTVYYFNHVGTIYSQKVLGFIVSSVGVLVDSGVIFDSNLIGNKFFLTREEAEQALKERESNEK